MLSYRGSAAVAVLSAMKDNRRVGSQRCYNGR